MDKRKIHEDRKRLQNPYAHVMGDGTLDALPRNSTFGRAVTPPRDEPVIDLQSIRRKVKDAGRLSRSKIEMIARDILARLWRDRESLFPDGKSADPIDVLDPIVALRSIGFRCDPVESLGQYWLEGEHVEVAGIIDRTERAVQISRQFPLPVRNFTAAHELGHALLHDGEGLHRDRALDGTERGVRRDRTEREADDFAVYFLMPEKQIRIEYEHRFKTREFILNEDTAFALNVESFGSFQANYDIRELSRLLARATQYDGVQFHSLAEQFGVSVEAMAIRLEELKIVRK